MIWEKIKYLLILILIVGCSNNVIKNEEPDYNLEEAITSTKASINYKLVVSNSFEADKESLKSQIEYEVDGDVVFFNQENTNDMDFSGYNYNGISYIEAYEEKVQMENYLDMDSIVVDFLMINSDDITYSNIKGNTLATFNIKAEEKNSVIQNFIDSVGMDESLIKSRDYVVTILFNDRVVEINKVISFEMSGGNYKNYTYTDKAVFSDYDKITVNLPEDLDSYIFKGDDDFIYDTKQLLIEVLGYVEDNGNLVLEYNGSETYVFDFNNKLFTYKLLSTSSTYNFSTNIGAYNNCVYDFSTDRTSGTCLDKEVVRIKETKIYLGIELESINKTISDIK